MRRRWFMVTAAIVATTLTGTLTGVGGGPAAARASGAAAELLALTNAARAAHGLGPLVEAGDLMSLASAHAAAEAASRQIFDDPSLESHVCCWSSVGENDGVAPTISVVEAALMASAPHRANILGDYTQIGIGAVVGGDGEVYVNEIFRLPMSVPAPAPTHRPAPPPTHAPAPRHVTRSSATAAPAGKPPAARGPVAASRDFARPPLHPITAMPLTTLLRRLGPGRPHRDPLASSVAWWSALTSR